MTKCAKIIIALLSVLMSVVLIFTGALAFNFNVPKNKDGAIIYQGRTYHLLSIFADVYEYETDKKIKNDFLEHTYTLKNDENNNFLIVHGFRDSSIYTCIPVSDDYFDSPAYPSEATLYIGDEAVPINIHYDWDTLCSFIHFKGVGMVEYNPDSCTLVEYKIKDKNIPVSYKYKKTLFIFDGNEWLIYAKEEHHDDFSKYYAYKIPHEIRYTTFDSFAYKYFEETYRNNQDFLTDPSMATIAD